MPSKPAESSLLPLATLLLGATFWGVLWYPLRLLEAHGLGGLWTTLILYGTALLIGVTALVVRGNRPHASRWLLLLLCASGWCNVAFILAVLEGNVVRVLLLFYLSPLWTVLLSRWLLQETLSAAVRLTMLVAMAGALIMLWDVETGFPWPREAGDWLAITSGFAFAVSNVTVRRIQEVSVWGKTVAAWGGVVILAGGWIYSEAITFPAVDVTVIGAAVALGAFGLAAMTLAVVYGVTHMPAHRAAVVLLFELVVGAASAQWLTDEVVRPQEWAGGALILLAGWLAAHAQVRETRGRVSTPSP